MVFRKSVVTPSVNFLVKSKSEKKEIPKLLRFIFVIFQIVFGLDNGFIQSDTPKKKFSIKLCNFLQASFYTGYVFFVSSLYPGVCGIWLLTIIVIYLIFAILLISRKYSYYDFQNDLNTFDREIKADHLSYRLDLRIIINISVLLLYYISKYVLVSEISNESNFDRTGIPITFFAVISEVCCLGVDFVRIIYFLVFSCACWRIKNFIEFVKKDNADIVACQYLYKSITDITEKAKSNFDIVFIVTLIYNTVSITVQLFLPFAGGTVKTESVWVLSSNIVSMVKNLLIMFAPTFTAGLLSSEVDKLVLTLRDKVLGAKDEKQRVDIRRFIGYIEARPLKFTICGVVPLDWNLPVIVVNMSFTYLIVMIQFTHKY